MPNDSQTQDTLVQAIEGRADVQLIRKLLASGAVANDAGVMQAFERLSDIAPKAWLDSVASLPEFAEALSLRKDADQAAFDLMESIEGNDFEGVSNALDDMAAAGDDADQDIGDGSMLALAVQRRCDIEIIELLLAKGGADPHDFSSDAIDELKEVEEGAWKTKVEKLFRSRISKSTKG